MSELAWKEGIKDLFSTGMKENARERETYEPEVWVEETVLHRSGVNVSELRCRKGVGSTAEEPRMDAGCLYILLSNNSGDFANGDGNGGAQLVRASERRKP